MFLRLPVALILALCAATCAREHLNPKLVSKNIHLRTIEPSVSDEFCNCFDGNSGEEVRKYIKFVTNTSKCAVANNCRR